jgi:hypothetical protein
MKETEWEKTKRQMGINLLSISIEPSTVPIENFPKNPSQHLLNSQSPINPFFSLSNLHQPTKLEILPSNFPFDFSLNKLINRIFNGISLEEKKRGSTIEKESQTARKHSTLLNFPLGKRFH